MATSRVRICVVFLLSCCSHYALCKPEHIHISLSEDPLAMGVTWSTKEQSGESMVQYGLEGHSDTKKTKGKSQLLLTGLGPLSIQYVHKVLLTSLAPNSNYWYRCGGESSGWSKYYKFKTLPNGHSWKPRFAIYGDLGSVNAQIVGSLINKIQKNQIDLILHAGDIAYDMHVNEGKVGDQFLRLIEPIASRVPYMVAVGNHETFRNFTNFKGRFYMPGTFDNMMYKFRVGPVLVVAVSTEVYYFNKAGGPQAIHTQYRWLDQILQEANDPTNRQKTPWIIVYGHRPMYCSNSVNRRCTSGETKSRKGSSSIGGKGLEELLYKHGVDLVFWGHQHCYERLFPIYNKNIFNGSRDSPYVNPRAPIHITAGCAGNSESKHYFLKEIPSWSAKRLNDYGYVRLDVVSASKAILKYISTEKGDAAVDEVTIVKNKHGSFSELFPEDNE